MTELISAKDTLNFLSKSAPRPWVKRMLLWMIVNEELASFCRKGRSVAKSRAFAIILEAIKGDAEGNQRSALIRKHFEPEMAEKLIAANDMDEFEELIIEWNENDEPREVSSGHFFYASDVDWDRGDITVELFSFQNVNRDLFWDEEELLTSNFPNAEYVITLSGWCFPFENIEMLQPHMDIEPSQERKVDAPGRIGRPQLWDWEGVTAHLLSIAQTPDGLPTGPGAQAKIEGLTAEWFMASRGNSPATSQLRKHAAKIMAALKKPESL